MTIILLKNIFTLLQYHVNLFVQFSQFLNLISFLEVHHLDKIFKSSFVVLKGTIHHSN